MSPLADPFSIGEAFSTARLTKHDDSPPRRVSSLICKGEETWKR